MNDPVAILKRDHREAEQMLKQLEGSKSGSRRRTTVAKLAEALTLHMQIEEQLVYPVVARVIGAETAEEAEIEHRLAREALTHLQEMVDEPGFLAVVDMLKAGVKHHVRDEEREVFPALKRKLDREQLMALGDEVAEMKGRPVGGSRRGSSAGSRPASRTSARRRPAKARARA